MHQNQLDAFRLTVKHKNFKQAADLLYITQPALSSRIKALENELGVKLFDTDNKRMIFLTPYAEKLYPYAEHILSLWEQAKAEILQEIARSEIIISVAGSPTISTYCLPEIINKINAEYHNIFIKVYTVESSVVVELVKNGQCSLGFCNSNYVKLPDELVEYELITDKTVLISAVNSYLDQDTPLSFRCLEELILISSKNTTYFWKEISDFYKKHNVRLKIVSEIDNFEAIKAAVINNYGQAFVPELSIQKELFQKQLVTLKLSPEPMFERTICVIAKKSALALPEVKLALEFIRKHFRKVT